MHERAVMQSTVWSNVSLIHEAVAEVPDRDRAVFCVYDRYFIRYGSHFNLSIRFSIHLSMCLSRSVFHHSRWVVDG